MQTAAALVSVLLLAGFPCTPVAAQTASAPRLASKEEHKSCVLDKNWIESRQAQMVTRVDTLNAISARLQAESSAYMKASQRRGLKTPADVQAYNQMVLRFNARGKELERDQSELLKDEAAIIARVLEINGRCAGLMVSQEVADEVTRELKRRESE